MPNKLLQEALQDVKVLQEAAVENAKNVLVEAISPQVKEFMNKQIEEDNLKEMGGDLDPSASGGLNPELLKKLLMLLTGGGGLGQDTMGPEVPEPGMPSMGDEEDELPESGMYEAHDDSEQEDDKEEMEENVKLDEADLQQAWQEVVREEAALEEAQVPSPTVHSEFGAVQNPNKNAKGGLGQNSAPGQRGLQDKEKEEMWKDAVPPVAQDWSVKEGVYKKQIANLASENKKLKNEINTLNSGFKELHRKLVETNLFNSKLLFTNKLLQSVDNLTNEQRLTIIETFDTAQNLREVELIFNSLSESFAIAGVLSEGKQSNKHSRNSRFTTSATANMLKESSKEEKVLDEELRRMQHLAGILRE